MVPLSELIDAARRRGWLVAGLPITLAAVVVIVALLLPRTYTSYASFTPRASDLSRNIGALGGLASQLGVNVAADPSSSPDFFGDLVTSRPILTTVVADTFDLGAPAGRTTGVAFFEGKGDTPAARVDDAAETLKKKVAVSRNPKTGVVELHVTTRSAALSAALAKRILDEVNTFNRESRNSRAIDDQRFADQRLRDLQNELRAAEDSLAEFKTGNHAFTSARLALEQQRLERAVTMREQMYSTVRQLYEQSRLEAARTTPVMTIVETPRPAARPDPRHLLLKAGTALLLGLVAALFLVVSGMRTVATPDAREIRYNPLA